MKPSVHFPGAINSKFTSKLEVSNPTEDTAMPTFRVMDSDGNLVDPSQGEPDLTQDQITKMYTDMVTGIAAF